MQLDKSTIDILKRLNVHLGWRDRPDVYQPKGEGLAFPIDNRPKELSKISFTGNEDDLMELLKICLKLKEINEV